jgi:predicted GNAT family acetyltransferase
MSDSKLSFQESKTKKEIEDTYNFNMDVFAESTDFGWTLEDIKKEIKDGWKLYNAQVGEEIVAAIFMKKQKDVLLTKNTPIKIDFQGNGFSHQIKDYYEKLAKDEKIKTIINFCPADSFRMISLNERHGYKKTGKTYGKNNFLVEWEKKIS